MGDQKLNQFISQNKLALIVVLACVPLAMRMVGPNGLYGFRFGRALEGTEAWYEVNKMGAICVIIALVVGVAVKQVLLSQGLMTAVIQKYGSLVDTLFLFIGIIATLAMTRK